MEQLRRRACLLLGLTRLFVRAHRSVGESRKPPLQIHLLPTECRQLRAQFALVSLCVGARLGRRLRGTAELWLMPRVTRRVARLGDLRIDSTQRRSRVQLDVTPLRLLCLGLLGLR